jgi:hypothetical protein
VNQTSNWLATTPPASSESPQQPTQPVLSGDSVLLLMRVLCLDPTARQRPPTN